MAPQAISGNIASIDATSFTACLKKLSITEIDTSARYGDGKSETLIGENQLGNHFTIDSKFSVPDQVDGCLTPENIEQGAANSLKALALDKVNILYCPAPDYKTPIAIQAKAFDEQYRKGRYLHLGLSNMPLSMIQEWMEAANKEGYVKPCYYQGQYNLFSRGYEAEQLPLLEKHGIHFVAFSPLAGGFLMGKVSRDEKNTGRFSSATSTYSNWYDRPSLHDALDKLRTIAATASIPIEALSLRWLFYHSALQDTDKVLVGGSRLEHYEQTMAVVDKDH